MTPLELVFAFLTVVAGLKAIEHRGDAPAPLYTIFSVAVYVLATITVVLTLIPG